MSEFEASLYQDLRTYIKNNLTHVAIVDSGGNEGVRIDIAADSRAQWLDTPSTNPMTLSVTIKGVDSDITTPMTVLRAELYPSSSSTTRKAYDDSPSNPTLEAANDEVTLKIDVEMPNV